MRRMISPDRVALTGTLVRPYALLLTWLILKPTRLAVGPSLNLWESLGGGAALVGVRLLL